MATVSSTDPASQAVANPQAALSSASNGLGQDAFMKLLVAQISHQDPLKPMDDTAFVAQLAQFSQLEQSMGMNKRLDAMTAQTAGLANTDLASLVGKQITISGNKASLAGDGTGAPMHFTLAAPATDVTVTITDGSGTAVRTMKLGAEQAGNMQVTWDGKNDTGIAQPAGVYKVSVAAKGKDGAAVQVTQQSSGMLKQVSFADGYAKLILADGTSAPASDLVSVDAPPTTK
jgi:flagellar basal-body rod modification protein FlgD